MILSGQSADHKNNWYLPHLNSWSWVWTHDDLLYFWPNKHWSFFTMSLFSVSTVRALVWLWSCVISGRFLCRRWATFRPWRASGVNHLPRQLDGMRLRYWELLSLTCLPSFVFVQWGSGRHDGHPCGLILVLETAKWTKQAKESAAPISSTRPVSNLCKWCRTGWNSHTYIKQRQNRQIYTHRIIYTLLSLGFMVSTNHCSGQKLIRP